MLLTRLKLTCFRIYREADIRFTQGVHVLHGENGAGKTTILEAIYYLALTKSFRSSVEKNLIFSQQNMFRIEGELRTAEDQLYNAAIAYSTEQGKHLTVNGHKPDRLSDYIGEIPLVLLHPADLQISQGGPHLRRRFLDVLLSQSSRLYLDHLIRYNRSLRQRNQLLQSRPLQRTHLLSWEDHLVQHGLELVRRRRDTIRMLSNLTAQYYRALSNRNDAVRISYQTNVETGMPDDPEQQYRQSFEAKREREHQLGATIIGPHRDELDFYINNRPLKAVASQGEHKTFVIALKLAEFHYLQQQRQQAPILLFDDIFGELDAGRIKQMLEQLSHIGQVFVTTTSRNFFDKVRQPHAPTHYHLIQRGRILEAQA